MANNPFQEFGSLVSYLEISAVVPCIYRGATQVFVPGEIRLRQIFRYTRPIREQNVPGSMYLAPSAYII